MIFSKPVTYAIRALIYLAERTEEGPILGATIAAEAEIPPAFVVKILGTLITAGYVSSTRGPGGGFTLSGNPDRITLYDVLTLFERAQLATQCLMGFGKCDDDQPCPVHEKWREGKQHLDAFLMGTTIGALATSHRAVRAESAVIKPH